MAKRLLTILMFCFCLAATADAGVIYSMPGDGTTYEIGGTTYQTLATSWTVDSTWVSAHIGYTFRISAPLTATSPTDAVFALQTDSLDPTLAGEVYTMPVTIDATSDPLGTVLFRDIAARAATYFLIAYVPTGQNSIQWGSAASSATQDGATWAGDYEGTLDQSVTPGIPDQTSWTGPSAAFLGAEVTANTPEPGTTALIGAGLLGVVCWRRRRTA